MRPRQHVIHALITPRHARLIVFSLAPLVTACQSTQFSQTHYVGVLNPDTGDSQFYKFEIAGHPGLNKMQYVTGWYDTEGLQSLVGEHSANTFGEGSLGGDAPTQERQSYLVTGPQGQAKYVEGKQFAIIMAADPKPILNAISGLAEDTELLNALKHREAKRTGNDLRFIGELADKFIMDEDAKKLIKAWIESRLPKENVPTTGTQPPQGDSTAAVSEGNPS